MSADGQWENIAKTLKEDVQELLIIIRRGNIDEYLKLRGMSLTRR